MKTPSKTTFQNKKKTNHEVGAKAPAFMLEILLLIGWVGYVVSRILVTPATL